MSLSATYTARLKSALAASPDWEYIGDNRVRRMSEHPTPENIPAHWWPDATYPTIEIITFLPRGERVPTAFHWVATCPWVEATKRKISAKRALELVTG